MNAETHEEIIDAFADVMKGALNDSRYTHHWHWRDQEWLLGRLEDEARELRQACSSSQPGRDIAHQAADVAVLAMIIADRAGGLPSAEGQPESDEPVLEEGVPDIAERLRRWIRPMGQPERLPGGIDHPVVTDVADAADRIARMDRERVEAERRAQRAEAEVATLRQASDAHSDGSAVGDLIQAGRDLIIENRDGPPVDHDGCKLVTVERLGRRPPSGRHVQRRAPRPSEQALAESLPPDSFLVSVQVQSPDYPCCVVKRDQWVSKSRVLDGQDDPMGAIVNLITRAGAEIVETLIDRAMGDDG